jgi:hypothetical protein
MPNLLSASLAAFLISIAAAQSQGSLESGNVTSVAGGKITLAESNGTTMTFSASDLAPDVKITLGGQAKKITDIKVGTKLNVLVGVDFQIHVISDGPVTAPARPPAPAAPAAAPKPAAPAQWNTPSINGKVRWWTGVVSERGTEGDPPNQTMNFTLTHAGSREGSSESQAFKPNAKTHFYVLKDGKNTPATFADIVLRATVSVAVQDGQVLQATVRK